MARADLGALWDAWRTRSDEEALLQLLDEVEPELLNAARRYSRDESSAHDLVQETWQAALSKAHAYDASQPLVPWLIGFLLVESKRERRRSSRGVDPDRLHAREEPPPDHAASHDEQRRMVKSAVASLPVLYREVVELTYERGLEPAQIAEQLKRAPGTVRVQLHRGLAKLREALPAGLSLGVAVMLLGGTSHAALHATLADAALARADEIARAAPTATATVGAWKIVAAILALVSVAATVAWWARSESSTRATTDATLAHNVERDARPQAALELESTGASNQRVTAATNTVDATSIAHFGVYLVGTVRGFAPDAKNAHEHFAVTLRPTDTKLESLQAEVPADGRFEVDVSNWYLANGARPHEFFCVVDSPRYMPAHAVVWLNDARFAAATESASHADRVEIPASIDFSPAACVVTGRALLPAGIPDHGDSSRAYAALFEMDQDGSPASEPTEAIEASSDGRFRLRSPHNGAHVLAVVNARTRPTTIPLALPAGVVRDVGTIVCDMGSSLAGFVVRADRSSVAGMRVSARLQVDQAPRSLHGHPIVWANGRFEHPGHAASTDQNGRFLIDGLAPLDYQLDEGDGPDDSMQALRLEVEGSGELRSVQEDLESLTVKAPAADIELRCSFVRVELHVTANGAPVPGCEVVRLVDGRADTAAYTNANGSVELRAAHPVSAVLQAKKLGFIPSSITITPEAFASGRPIEVALAPGPAPAWVTFEPVGAKFDAAFVTLAPTESIDPARLGRLERRDLVVTGMVCSELDASGRMRTAIAPGRYTGEIHDKSTSGAAPMFPPTWFDIDVPPGVEYRFRVDLSAGGRFRVPAPQYTGKAARLTVELADERANVVPVTFTSSVLRTDARQGRTGGTGLLVGSSSLSSALQPGTYTVRVTAPDAKPFEARVVIEAGKTIELSVALEPR